ncbi:MAG: hypothetical protein H6Q75_158 [Firmicutes bacterium]|nr:hypothetical protein [Bacillota bacterium]
MLKSMTGFGRGEYMDAEHRFIVEIKAVNNRYNEIVIRMPKMLASLEDKIRRTVSNVLARGRIDVYITLDDFGQKKRTVRVDKELAIAYHKAMNELRELLELPSGETGSLIARYPDVLKVEEIADDITEAWPKLEAATRTALSNLMDMRLAEGANIQKDLLGRIDVLVTHIRFIEERAPKIAEEYREKLMSRMRDVLATVSVETDEVRILQEAALFADKINITEELVRLNSHLMQLKETLCSDAAVGRKLDFIIQEVNRETNTIGSKINDYSVANVVVEIKSEIEKIREQIQNIE